MKVKNLFIILSLFKALICGVSPINASYDDANNFVTGTDDESVLVSNDDQAIVVDSFTSASNANVNKNEISGHSHVITGTVTGIEFAGKKLASNGKLCANLHNNNITDIGYGINMYHPNVIYLNITNCNIGINSENIDAAIATNGNFNCTGYIGVFNSNFSGSISADFVNATGNNKGNNTGFP